MYNTFSFITSSLNLSSVISISVMRSCALVHLCSALFATLCLTQLVPCVCICQSRGPSIQNWVLYCKDFCPQLRSYSGGGATSRPSMEPSENQCLLPAALCVSGHIGFQRTKIEVSTRSHCGPIEFTKCSSCFPCWPAASGDRNYFTRNTWVSLERLIPLVEHVEAWRNLLNISPWVLRTVEKGYRIQFEYRPPKFNGIVHTIVSPEQAGVMDMEVQSLLVKEAIEIFPPHERETGFYSRYSIVPKKDGGLRPIIDLRLLNRFLRRFRFKMLTIPIIVSQIRS